MVLSLLIIASTLTVLWVAQRTRPVDPMAVTGTVVFCLVLSIVILGLFANRGQSYTTKYLITNIIPLNQGYAVETLSGEGIYVNQHSANFTTDCEEAGIVESTNITPRWLLGFRVTADTQYSICIPNEDPPVIGSDKG